LLLAHCSSTQKMENFYWATWRHVPGHYCENF
jgi:hypothetical protein